ncbi:activator of HSP90 ATPase [Mesorhizobium sp. L-8-10]|uniref:SRPBCC family protein n=1 Tax=Mesorhizobium sp. L-8-10 TaxID=2744523 RepID=UPI00192967FC|nr:SRPBCC domain-containing protein [Mesorhizobium sp. L-8-10]BCH29525.1 activator of HSP90 ATPase [Mesorhizobium sp. L-8-10]
MRIRKADFLLDMRRTFRAPPSLVFETFTRAELLRRWMCPHGYTVQTAHADARIGGGFRIEMQSPEGVGYEVAGRYLEMRAPELLVLSWIWEKGHGMAGIETIVRVELSAQGSDTLMVMTHSGLLGEHERADHEQGWSGAFDNLAGLLARLGGPGSGTSA